MKNWHLYTHASFEACEIENEEFFESLNLNYKATSFFEGKKDLGNGYTLTVPEGSSSYYIENDEWVWRVSDHWSKRGNCHNLRSCTWTISEISDKIRSAGKCKKSEFKRKFTEDYTFEDTFRSLSNDEIIEIVLEMIKTEAHKSGYFLKMLLKFVEYREYRRLKNY